MPFIYKITNRVNGKVYIGQTIKQPQERFTEHKYIANHPQFDHKSKIHAALRKYGFENFVIETIQECEKEELNELEIYWIQKYDSYRNGYNNTVGGCGKRRDYSDEFLMLWKQGNTISEIARKIKCDRETVSLRLIEYGITHEEISDRWKQVMSKTKSPPIYQYDLDGNYIAEYASVYEAAEKTNTNIGCIRGVICGQHGSAGGFQWSRKKLDNIGKNEKKPRTTPKEIHQYSMGGEYIRSFKSMYQAEKSVGTNTSVMIRRVINGTANHAYGYKWSHEKKTNYYD